jgi:outer membrane protein assembly factor BamB
VDKVVHRSTRKVLAAASLLLLLVVTGRAEDWPQWRGPHRDGVWNETGILETFPRKGLKVRWRVLVGPGWSSPVVAQGRVYLTDSQLIRPQAKERILCFAEETGKALWSYAYEVHYPDWAFTPGQETGPSATPLVEAGKAYFLGPNGHLHCFDTAKGELLWKKHCDQDYKLAELWCRASPLIEGKLLILFLGGKPGACVVALDKDSGKEVWKALDESVTNGSPIAVTAGGKRQLIVWTQESVTSLNPATGTVYWRERMVTSNNDAVATPVGHKNLLLVSGLMFQLDKDRPAASILWPGTKPVARRILSNTSTPLFLGDHVYSARSSGELVCLEARTGKEVWKTDKVTTLRGGASIHLTAQGSSVLLYTDKGELIRAKLTPRGYQEISRASVLEPVYPFGGRKVNWAPPAYANRHIFARNEKELVRVSLAAEP